MPNDWIGPDPMMQQQMMMYSMGIGQSPYSPSFAPRQYGLFGQTVPPTEDQLNFERDAQNLMQDQQSLMFSPETMFLSAPAGLDPQAFEDVVTYEQVPRPGYDFVVAQLQRDPETGQPIQDPNTGRFVGNSNWAGKVAEHIMGGGSASSAFSEIYQLVTTKGEPAPPNPEEDPNGLEAQYRALYYSLPRMYDMGQPQIDWMTAQNDAKNWEQHYHEDPKPGPGGAPIYDDEGNLISQGGALTLSTDQFGNEILVQENREKSPVAELFAEYGLPSPYDRYEAEDFMSGDWQMAQQAYLAQVPKQQAVMQDMRQSRRDLRTERGGLSKAEEDYTKAVQDYQRDQFNLTPYGQLVEMERYQRTHPATTGEQTYLGEEPFSLETYQSFGLDQPPLPGIPGQGPGRHMLPSYAGEGEHPEVMEPHPFTLEDGSTVTLYSRPGQTLSEALREQAGWDSAQLLKNPEMTPEIRAMGADVGARRKKVSEAREEYRGFQSGYDQLRESLLGAKEELYSAPGYGQAWANQWITQQEGQTPYLDALMARRMVPYAAGSGGWSAMPQQPWSQPAPTQPATSGPGTWAPGAWNNWGLG